MPGPTPARPSPAGDTPPVPAADVLVVEDEPSLRTVLARTLGFAGHRVRSAGGVAEARAAVEDAVPDLVVLDVMLPDGSGLDLCAHLRTHHQSVAVVFLTARDDVDDRLTGFALGGDDYLTKPFSVAELVARVAAVLRRSLPSAPVSLGGAHPDALVVGDLSLSEGAHEVTRGGDHLELSPTEFRLLALLALNAGRVLSKQQILEQVWGYDFGGDGGVVEKFVSQLRRKVDDGRVPLLHTVRGFGYVLREPR
ncbi:response regulator transcription factor [Nocardioides sp. GY 10127]|uniref:response regulator transcription factor n=1 Tax=Nocardioides sp. GY 10127 TaxID=2569762 RepID=UPI0010A7FEC1|nr:response regulator transcription factor [Nocardioides sp. GY 10127]TIC84067.1 response regulator transcription factor [Nocardioides sp. GY 10127]